MRDLIRGKNIEENARMGRTMYVLKHTWLGYVDRACDPAWPYSSHLHDALSFATRAEARMYIATNFGSRVRKSIHTQEVKGR